MIALEDPNSRTWRRATEHTQNPQKIPRCRRLRKFFAPKLRNYIWTWQATRPCLRDTLGHTLHHHHRGRKRFLLRDYCRTTNYHPPDTGNTHWPGYGRIGLVHTVTFVASQFRNLPGDSNPMITAYKWGISDGVGTLLANADGQFSTFGDGDAAPIEREALVGIYKEIWGITRRTRKQADRCLWSQHCTNR